ncbi:glutamine amidotransferase class-II [Pseudarthrobacter chlorophenolicus A6]|uniref:Glutamine amidotransferase class-II n=1 Tax=Pseudarthrobacter chlorophenolicus (strain ATCC 700700 / DSM 12829 / CIP 107037 / JCM 12360 / KCTC 9906 / NCIMB 13794 / A6) TaxID=452863 RepID=B8HHI9_PSECP|nr:glutamine amidotransferase [Pseudarthrobacter chlorophenolicus]ACL41480.1 glutamine amidotransferase class-II [Pseudarthrobacter chlorophenolicus A6]SDQ63416.1 Glutamate synthase domain-containing protein 1 [Pseudarthrobacter chlorophenolicus]
MCGIAALQLRNPSLHPRMGSLLSSMLCQIVDRGPDSAGLAVYNTPGLVSPGTSTLSLLGKDQGITTADITSGVAALLPADAAAAVRVVGDTTLVSAAVGTDLLAKAVTETVPGATIIGRGEHVAVMKSVGHPMEIAAEHGLEAMAGSQGLSHTRMATESAVTAGGSHPFSVADDLCLVHNGSFSNHATVRRELKREGVVFDSENDTEVGARYVASRLKQGDTLEEALVNLGKVLDGFYTLVVTTADSMAVVRDPIACKPAIIAETDDYVAMASEYRALAALPGIDNARIFEPEPGKVYTWSL